jgi:2,4-dienoyl-CoA reductase-like NADH-dependent reductase (Old Yellow Enzyme family)
MSALFSPIKIRNITFKNRFICSSLHLANCDKNGIPTNDALNFYAKLAKNQCGLIIPGCVSHLPIKGMKNQIQITNDEQADAWKDAIKSLHSFGSKIFFQVSLANAIGKQKFHTKK